MSEFTPGPWFSSHRVAGHDEVGDEYYTTQVYTADGRAICDLSWYPKPAVNGVTGTYRAGNAKAISAVPDMYDAIKAALTDDPDWRRLCVDALDKAEGRTT